jgi:hypothetical protein
MRIALERRGRPRMPDRQRDARGRSRGESPAEIVATARAQRIKAGADPADALNPLYGTTLGILYRRWQLRPSDPGGVSADRYNAAQAYIATVFHHAEIMGLRCRGRATDGRGRRGPIRPRTWCWRCAAASPTCAARCSTAAASSASARASTPRSTASASRTRRSRRSRRPRSRTCGMGSMRSHDGGGGGRTGTAVALTTIASQRSSVETLEIPDHLAARRLRTIGVIGIGAEPGCACCSKDTRRRSSVATPEPVLDSDPTGAKPRLYTSGVVVTVPLPDPRERRYPGSPSTGVSFIAGRLVSRLRARLSFLLRCLWLLFWDRRDARLRMHDMSPARRHRDPFVHPQ